MPTEALLVMDMQNGIVERFPENADSLLEPLAETIATARAVLTEKVFPRQAAVMSAKEWRASR
jgi:nicotinamidase-related amidase